MTISGIARLAIVAAMAFSAFACGLKGDLYLPEPEPQPPTLTLPGPAAAPPEDAACSRQDDAPDEESPVPAD
ncbi:MAG: lipoprotein, partial [Gammaproteobacteria bacterium]